MVVIAKCLDKQLRLHTHHSRTDVELNLQSEVSFMRLACFVNGLSLDLDSLFTNMHVRATANCTLPQGVRV